MNAKPGRLDRGTQESAGRSLAVGAGDMEDRRQLLLRIAQSLKQRGDPFQPQYVAPRRQHRQPVELTLDGGIGGAGGVCHDVA